MWMKCIYCENGKLMFCVNVMERVWTTFHEFLFVTTCDTDITTIYHISQYWHYHCLPHIPILTLSRLFHYTRRRKRRPRCSPLNTLVISFISTNRLINRSRLVNILLCHANSLRMVSWYHGIILLYSWTKLIANQMRQ